MPRKRAPKRQYPYFDKRGVYYYAFYIDQHGMRHRRSLKTKDQVVASARFTKLLQDVDRGVLGFHRIPKRFALTDAVSAYLEKGTHDLSPRSVERHEGCFRLHLIPFFPRTQFRAVTPKKVLAYIRHRQESDVAPSTIYKELAALSAVFTFGIQEEWIQFNPVLAIKKPKLRQIRPNYVPTEDELNRILEHLYPGARRFFLFFCNTGCRLGEAARLNIADVDFSRDLVRFVRKGNRLDFHPMSSTVRQIIEAELFERPDAQSSDPLFLNRERRRYRSIRTPLTSACREAQVPHCTHHSLCHAYATILHDRGERVREISKLLGHTNPTTTRNIYIHWRDAAVRDAAEAAKIGTK